MIGIAVTGYFSLTAKIKRDKEDSDKAIFGRMDEKAEQVITAFDDKIKVFDSKFGEVNTRINKDQEDIEDVEQEMKDMVTEFKAMCEKLQKHDFILSDVLPSFKSLQKEFNNFKTKVEIRMVTNSNLVNSNEVYRDQENDSEHK